MAAGTNPAERTAEAKKGEVSMKASEVAALAARVAKGNEQHDEKGRFAAAAAKSTTARMAGHEKATVLGPARNEGKDVPNTVNADYPTSKDAAAAHADLHEHMLGLGYTHSQDVPTLGSNVSFYKHANGNGAVIVSNNERAEKAGITPRVTVMHSTGKTKKAEFLAIATKAAGDANFPVQFAPIFGHQATPWDTDDMFDTPEIGTDLDNNDEKPQDEYDLTSEAENQAFKIRPTYQSEGTVNERGDYNGSTMKSSSRTRWASDVQLAAKDEMGESDLATAGKLNPEQAEAKPKKRKWMETNKRDSVPAGAKL